MRNLIMWNLVSLDGHFEGEKKWDLDWHEYAWGEELQRFSLEQLESADMLVFGRVTYEGMAAHWPKARGAVADSMNRLPKIVCSRTLETAAWNNTTLLKDNVTEELARLKQQGNGNMFVFGSANLSKSLMNAGLFDEYRLVMVPVILGAGRPLFGDGLNAQKLRLHEARALSTGGVLLRYAPRKNEQS